MPFIAQVLAALLLLLAAPALATGPAQPPPCRALAPQAPNSRASDVPLRGERAAPRPGCGAPHGVLHRMFHGHRRR